MGFSKQEYWSGCHFLLQGIFLTQGLNLLSPALAGRFFSTSATWEAHKKCYWNTPLYLHMASGCFCATVAGVSSHMTDHIARKVCLVYYLCYAKSLQLCPTLCDARDGSTPGSPVPGILQARTLEWVASFFSNAWTWKVKVKLFSCVWLLATPWTAAYQAPLPMGFSRQEYWSGVPLPSPT